MTNGSPSNPIAALTSVRAPLERKGDLPYARPASDLGHTVRGTSWRRRAEMLGSFGSVAFAIAGLTPGLPTFGPMLAATVLGGAALWSASRRVVATRHQNDALIDAMEAGRVDEAIAGFRDIIRTSGIEGRRSVAIANLAVALSRRGDHEAALGVVAYAEQKYASSKKQLFGQMLAMHAAHFLSLLGDADGAEAWIAEARKRGAPTELVDTSWTSAIVLLRRRRFAEALAEIDARWVAWEAKTPATSMRRVRMVRAFSLHALGRVDEVEGALAGTRPFAPGDYASMATEWPELRVFLVDHKLT